MRERVSIARSSRCARKSGVGRQRLRMPSTSSGIGISGSSLTSWRISAIGKSGARSSGPTGCPVPGCRIGCIGFGMSARTLYQRLGRSDSASRNFVCSTLRSIVGRNERICVFRQRARFGTLRAVPVQPATVAVLHPEAVVLEIVEQALRDAGHRVLATVDPSELVALARHVWIDVIVSDASFAGRAFVATLRSIQPQLQIVYGIAAEEHVQGYGADGVHAVVAPYTLAHLQKIVSDALASRRRSGRPPAPSHGDGLEP